MEEEDDKRNVVKIPILRSNNEDSDSDDCYEIDPIDFTCKLTFSSSSDADAAADDDDDVAITAAKGPVSLRDFPHPRHLCGNFPFDRTTPESYCSKCFCCLCEVVAPCSEWRGVDGHCNVSVRKSEGGPQYILLI
ncbi:hypothetical protein KSP40_PGU004017 [Platanthera guangdongensis]|uniref:Uncharacterized protein n=1 Tax=Platanthera guangdongensis TaxID=2320717 RepID=A0ABR2MIZ1_9ASPA